MSKTKDEQKKIIDWFDKTYKKRGFSYLRSASAYKTFINILNLKSGDSVLDVACGPGLFLKIAMEKGCKCSGIDASSQAIKMAHNYVPEADLFKSNAEFLPFSDNTFDVVVCLGALERFIDLKAALKEQLRVAKKNALFCFLVRNSNSLFWRITAELMNRQNHEGHQDAKSLDEWTSIFVSNGFCVKEILPDQWPLVKISLILPSILRRKFLSPIHKGIIPFRFSGEFIFVLSAENSA